MSRPRGTTLAGQLAALGFADTARAQRLVTGDLKLETDGPDAQLLEALAKDIDWQVHLCTHWAAGTPVMSSMRQREAPAPPYVHHRT